MKAYLLNGVGDLCYKDINVPDCPSGWCLVKVIAAGICSSDIPRIFETGTYHFPTVPGHEFSGIVSMVPDDKNAYLLGKKVGVFPLIPCQSCEFCRNAQYELCSHYDYLGSRRNGGFAEYVAVTVWNLIELNDNVSFVEAAMMEPLSVSLHAVKKMNLKSKDNVAIVGTGMIAFAAAQWALSLGVKSVTVIGRSEAKRRIAESIHGVKYLTYQENQITYDSVLEAVGTNDSINQSIELVKPGGVIVLMGNPEGDILFSKDNYWKIIRKQLIVQGTWNSSYKNGTAADWDEVRDSLENKTINVQDLVSHIFTKEQLMEALELMRQQKEPYCKVMTIWNEE